MAFFRGLGLVFLAGCSGQAPDLSVTKEAPPSTVPAERLISEELRAALWLWRGRLCKHHGGEHSTDPRGPYPDDWELECEGHTKPVEQTGSFFAPEGDLVTSMSALVYDGCYHGAIEFGRGRIVGLPEEAIAEALIEGAAWTRLQALACLVRVKAPRSIDAQWRTVRELSMKFEGPVALQLLDEIREAFESPSAKALLKRDPPADSRKTDTSLEWAIRAAGLVGDETQRSRVAELALAENLSCRLAASRALEDFDQD